MSSCVFSTFALKYTCFPGRSRKARISAVICSCISPYACLGSFATRFSAERTTSAISESESSATLSYSCASADSVSQV